MGTPVRTPALDHIATAAPTNEKTVESHPLSWACQVGFLVKPKVLPMFLYIKSP